MSVASVLERSGNVRDIREVEQFDNSPYMFNLGLSAEFFEKLRLNYINEINNSINFSSSPEIIVDHLSSALTIFGPDLINDINSEKIQSQLIASIQDQLDKTKTKELNKVEIYELMLDLNNLNSFAPMAAKQIKMPGDVNLEQYLNDNVQKFIKIRTMWSQHKLNLIYLQSQIVNKDVALQNLNSIWPEIKSNLIDEVKRIKDSEDYNNPNREALIFDCLSVIKLLDSEKYAELNANDKLIDFGKYMLDEIYPDREEYLYIRFNWIWNLGVIAGDIVMGNEKPELILPKNLSAKSHIIPEIGRFEE